MDDTLPKKRRIAFKWRRFRLFLPAGWAYSGMECICVSVLPDLIPGRLRQRFQGKSAGVVGAGGGCVGASSTHDAGGGGGGYARRRNSSHTDNTSTSLLELAVLPALTVVSPRSSGHKLRHGRSGRSETGGAGGMGYGGDFQAAGGQRRTLHRDK